MNCNDFINKVSSYIDNEISEIEKKEFETHLFNCDNCRKEYEFMINIIKDVSEQEQVELPDNYRIELNRKLKETAKRDKKINWKVMSSIAAGFMIMFVSISLLSDNFNFFNSSKKEEIIANQKHSKDIEQFSFDATSSMKTTKNESARISPLEGSQDKEIENFSTSQFNAEINSEESNTFSSYIVSRSLTNGRKFIKEAYISVEIEGLNKVSEAISDYVIENGGFIETLKTDSDKEEVNDNQGSYLIKVKIPSDKFDQTLEFLKKLGELKDDHLMINDVTEQYYRTETNLNLLYEQETSLKEILYKTEGKEDALLVEEELDKIKEEINATSKALKGLEESIIQSTITANLNTVSTEGN